MPILAEWRYPGGSPREAVLFASRVSPRGAGILRVYSYTHYRKRTREAVPTLAARLEAFLGHVDDLAEFNLPVAGGRRFFSEQLGGKPQRFYFLFDSLDLLLFHPKYVERVLHGGGLLKRSTSANNVASNSKLPPENEKHHEGTCLTSREVFQCRFQCPRW
jgi:hypothetical protein